MKYTEAKKRFEKVLNEQKTVQVSLLKQLMSDMNLTLEGKETAEAEYLKGRVRYLQDTLNARGHKGTY